MLNKNISLIALLMLLPIVIFSQLKLTTNRTDATYVAGESMNFVVTGGFGTANYVIHYDHGITPALARGTVQLGGTVNIPFQLNEPGTVICTVSGASGFDVTGAAFSPFEIQPYEDDPADFDSFWQRQKNRLAAVPISPQRTEIFTTGDNRTRDYKISLGNIEGRRVYGYLSIPVGGSNLPAVITHAAFGVGPNLCVPRPEIAADLNAISMSIWMHNTEPDRQSFDAYKPMQWDDPNSIYYRFGVLGIIRAIDYIYSLPEFRGSGIGLNGISEGGGMSMLVAGIDNRVTAVSASIFAHAEHTGYKYGKASGFPHYLQQAPLVIQGVDTDRVLNATKYYDVVRAAKRFDGAVLAAIGYEDMTSIPMAQFGAYNQLRGPSVLIHKVEGAHTNPNEFYLGKFDFYRTHLNLTGQKGYSAKAGNDQTVGNSAVLSATIEKNGVTDSSLPVRWEMVSGPTQATISAANSKTTNVVFSANGDYVFRVTATDKSELNTTKTFYTISDFVKITVTGNTSVIRDSDNDGVPDDEDCNDFNPNISNPGDPCNDFNPNTTNDVIQADCSCAGSLVGPTYNCPNLSANIGDSCNDGNPNTTNDVVQANCTCAGATIISNNSCNTTYQVDGDVVTVSPLNYTHNVVKIFDNNYQSIFSCADFETQCAGTQRITLPYAGTFFIQIQTYTDWSTPICNILETIVTQDSPVGAAYDCPSLSANIGDNCNDGNPNTTNDVVQANCTCAGTQAPPPPSNNCTTTFQLNGNVVTISPLNYNQNIVNIFDNNFGIVMSCSDWSTNCSGTQQFTLPYSGNFFIQIQTYSDWNTPICNIFEPIQSQVNTTCENITNGGFITGNENLCQNTNPTTITSSRLPSGGSGQIEYQWLASTISCPYLDSNTIPGASQASYSPGPLSETTYFRRLSRRIGCTEWFISNCIVKMVQSCNNNNNDTPTDGCLVDYNIDGNVVSYSGLNAPIETVKITKNNGTIAYNCETHFGTPCPESNQIQLPPGRYILSIFTGEDWTQNLVCNITETFQVRGNQRRLSDGQNLPSEKTPDFDLERLESEVVVFPNPADEILYVKLGKSIERKGTFTLFNQLGKVVKSSKLNQNQSLLEIQTSEFPAGVYFLKVENDGQSITKRIVINRK